MKKFAARAALASLIFGACSSGLAYAQFAKPEDAIKYRQSALTLIGSHFSRMGPVVKGQSEYNAEEVKANVATLKALSTLPWAGFGPGTEGGGARPEVWSDAAGFKQAQEKFISSVDNLSAAADSGDFAKVREAFGDTAASCKACHDAYRQKR